MNGFLSDVVYNPDRLLHPLKRVGAKGEGRFERVGWDEALDDVGKRLRIIIDEHGGEAVLPYSFAGTMGMVQGWSLGHRFFARLGATGLERTICGSTAAAGLSVTMGTSTGILHEDLLESRFIICGAVIPSSPTRMGGLSFKQRERLGRALVVIDPLRSATAARADWHLRPRIGTDSALALGMMHVIVREGLHDADYVERYTVGFDQLEERLDDYPPQRVAEIAGSPARRRRRARQGVRAQRARRRFRFTSAWRKHRPGRHDLPDHRVPARVGRRLARRGGGLLHDVGRLFGESMNSARSPPSGEAPTTRSVNMVQLGQALTQHVARSAIQAMIVYNSNPATIAPNQNLVVEGLKREDLFTVVVDHFVTDTARYADYVLPATTQAEHLDLLVPYGNHYLSLNLPAIEPRGESPPEHRVLSPSRATARLR